MKKTVSVKNAKQQLNPKKSLVPIDWDRHVVDVWKFYPIALDNGGTMLGLLMVGNPNYTEFQKLMGKLPDGGLVEDPTINPLRFRWQCYPDVPDPQFAMLQFKIVNNSALYLNCVIDLLNHGTSLRGWPEDNLIEITYITALEGQNFTVDMLNEFRQTPNRSFQVTVPLGEEVKKHLDALERDLGVGKYVRHEI